MLFFGGVIRGEAQATVAKTDWGASVTNAVLIHTGTGGREEFVDAVAWNADGVTVKGHVYLLHQNGSGQITLVAQQEVRPRDSNEVAAHGPVRGVLIPRDGPLPMPTSNDKLYVATYSGDDIAFKMRGRYLA